MIWYVLLVNYKNKKLILLRNKDKWIKLYKIKGINIKGKLIS